MIPNPSPFIYACLVSILVWLIIAYAVTADSRQKCETVASVDVCAWELR